MNEITRIHIAKVAYDIEVAAKKDLQKYLEQLEAYAENDDWLEDIEIRITELLQERGVQPNGVVSLDDVTAIREQLGVPEDFVGDGDIAVGPSESSDETTRRLYRNEETAVLGGVLGGIASYINVNPLWTRLAFIILIFASFGTAILVYFVLWIVLPPAKTATEKLQLTGKPVTLKAIKQLRDIQGSETSTSQVATVVRSILAYGAGVLFGIAAIGALIATIAGGAALLFGTQAGGPLEGIITQTWEVSTAYILLAVAGVLLTALFSLASYAFLSKKLTKRVGIAMVAITLCGVAAAGAAGSTLIFVDWNQQRILEQSRVTKKVQLPSKFSQITELNIDSKNENEQGFAQPLVEYIVSKESPRYELFLDANTKQLVPLFSYSEDGKRATLIVPERERANLRYYNQHPTLKIYGPALDTLNLTTGSVTYVNETPQDKLGVRLEKQSSLDMSGSYSTVDITTKGYGSVSLVRSSVQALKVAMDSGFINAGVVNSLEVTLPTACPDDGTGMNKAELHVSDIAKGTLMINTQERIKSNVKTPCGRILIGSDEDRE